MRYLSVLFLILSGCGQHAKTARQDSEFICNGSAVEQFSLAVMPAEPKFLVTGQSNAVSPAQNHSDYYSQTGLLTMNDPYADDTMRIPTVSNPFHGGIAWIYFADLLNRPVTIKNVAEANTTTRKWRDYLHLRILNALVTNSYDAILWVQGESDIGEKLSMNETCYNLKYIIQKSREIQPGIPWYIALNSAQNKPDNNLVRSAERAVISQGYANLGPDTDTLRINPNFVELGGGEFVGQGLEEHGKLWYEVFKHVL